MKETRQFNAADFALSIETYLTYFVLIGGQWTKINSIKNLPSILSDKKSEVEGYIKNKGLSGNKQEDMESVINYYNNLFLNKGWPEKPHY